jgi:hypothetical protein
MSPDRLVEQTLSEHRIKTASHTVAENDFQIAKRLEAIDSNVNELYRKTHTSFG